MAWGLPTSNAARAVESFSRQFEPDGNDFLYRRSQRAAPIRVTGDERDNFIRNYRRGLRRMTWVAAAATIVMIIVVSVLVSVTEDDLSQSLLYLLVAAVVLGIIPFSMRSWNAPARALTGRQVEGRERDASEVRLIRLAQVSWVQLLTAVAVVPFVLLNLSGQFDIWHGWGLLGPVIASLIIVLVIVQAIRKWLLAAAN